MPRNTLCCPPKFAWTIVLNCSLKYCIFPKAFEDNNLCKIWGADRVYYGRLQNSQLTNRPFSHDVTTAILVFQNNETAASLVSQTSPMGDEPFYLFCSNKSAQLLATWAKTLCSWFATTWQGGHVGGRYNRIFLEQFTWKWSLVPRGEKCFCSLPTTWPSWRTVQTSNMWVHSYSFVMLAFSTSRLDRKRTKSAAGREPPRVWHRKIWYSCSPNKIKNQIIPWTSLDSWLSVLFSVKIG